MTGLRSRVFRCLCAVACAQALMVAPAGAQQAERFRPESVQDLAYGEVLYFFFQDDYFSALTHLLAGQARDEFDFHRGEAEVLLGGLYLSYGQHQRAGEIFDRLLEQYADPSLHDRAWFFLAKIWYQRGYLDEARQALGRIGAALPGELERERYMLDARVLMDQGRFDDALDVLARWQDPDDEWIGYAKYNVGVALVRLGRTEDGAAVLDELGVTVVSGEELSGLRDKANVALGFAWLQAGRPELARPSLERVRLNGPFSSKALLGVGWADVEIGDYQAALTPWLELSGRDILDPAVQESLLAVPYAFSQLGANRQAADYYLRAIDTFNTEIGRMDAAVESVEQGAFVDELLGDGATDASGWYWRLDELPDTVEAHYLYELLASNEFQEGLKNYRDLLYMRENLTRWTQSLGAFDDILDTRERAYVQRLPAIASSLGSVDLDALAARRVANESRLVEIERDENVWALGTEREQDAWATLQAMAGKLDRLGNTQGADAAREKHRFLSGVLYWNLYRDYKARMWQAKKNLAAVERDFRVAERAYHQVDAARAEWPERFTDLSARVGALTPQVASLSGQLQGMIARQSAFLKTLAARDLLAQRDRLSTYLVQARFALAAVYDRSAAISSAAEPGNTAGTLGAAP